MGFSVSFYARSCKANKHGLCPLEIAVNVNGTRKFINLPYKVTPEDFHKKRQPKELVQYMALMRTRANEIITEMLRHGEPLTTDSLMAHFKSGGYKSYTVNDLFNDYLDILRDRVGTSMVKSVYTKYELVKKLFFEFVNPEGECDKELTHAAILKYKAKVESKYAQGTAAGYLTKLKAYIRFGIDNGRLHSNPFGDIKIRKGENKIKYLQEWEEQMFVNGRLENASLRKVRDFAILQLSTGAAYADAIKFTTNDIKQKDGVCYIEKRRQKTGKVFTAVIIEPERFKAILAKYDGRAPQISNQKLNTYLKTIGDLLGIPTQMTTHIYRRTYASRLLNKGCRIEVVAAALGDDVNIVKKHYAQLQNDTVLNEISKVL